MKTTRANPHAWFFSYISELDGYNKNYEKVIRESVILDFTNGLTGSLSELYSVYPEQYKKMKAEIMSQRSDELDRARKRLIAALFDYLKPEKPTMNYVKAVACRSAKVNNFNDIPLTRLKALYRIFGTKNTKGMSETERKLIWSALRKENKN